MKRYTPFVPAYSGRATFEEDEKGEWVKWDDADEMRAALIYIIEYWNGGAESAVDAIEEVVATAKEILGIVDGEGK
jgi:hypothetical protein